MSTVVHISNIAPQTNENEVRDFFSFCGKITNLSVTPSTGAADASKSATVTFEKENAAKTALLLDNTQLGPSQVHVTAGSSMAEVAASAGTHTTAPQDDDDIPQEEKPRTRVLAEYLAHGYVISDQAIQHAITLDSKHGFSSRFTSALQTFDDKTKATERAREMDKSYSLTERANTSWRGLHSYFQKAVGTPTGQKLMDFYTQTEKQVLDVHNEARRLADLKAGKTSTGQNVPHQVPGTEKTTCQCGGNDGTCGCAQGKCNCIGCSKSATATAGTVPDAPTAAAEGVPKPSDTAATAPLSTNNS